MNLTGFLQEEMARIKREVAAEKAENDALMAGQCSLLLQFCSKCRVQLNLQPAPATHLSYRTSICAVWLDKSTRADSFLEAEHALLERVRTVEQRSADIKLECEERIRCVASNHL